MFSGFGQIASLMGNLPKIKGELEKLQGRIACLMAEGQAGGGMVAVTVNGQMRMTRCVIAAEAVADREMLEDFVIAAANQAVEKMRALVAAETQRMATELGLPPGFSLPGLGG